MKNIKITSALTLGFLLLGCDSRIDAVNQEMANIRNQPPLPIEPAPDFMPVETFNYAAHQIKSPFLPSSLAAELKIMAGKRVYPNLSPQPQAYQLESPSRLILDFDKAQQNLKQSNIPVATREASSVEVTSDAQRARLTVNLTDAGAFTTRVEGNTFILNRTYALLFIDSLW